MAVCIPFLGVSNIERTVLWYEALGFRLTGSNRFWEPDAALTWAQLEWENAAFMLFYSPVLSTDPDDRFRVKDAGLYFKVTQMNGLVEKLKQTAKIIEITDASIYGKFEVVFEDLNGFRITFTTDPHLL